MRLMPSLKLQSLSILFLLISCEAKKDKQNDYDIVNGKVIITASMQNYSFGVCAIMSGSIENELSAYNSSDTVKVFYSDIILPPQYEPYILIQDYPPYAGFEILDDSTVVRKFSLKIPKSNGPFTNSNRICVTAWCDTSSDARFDWPFEVGRFPYKHFKNGDSVLVIEFIMDENSEYYTLKNDAPVFLKEKNKYDNFIFRF